MEVYCTLESLYILTPVLHESQLLARAFYLISTACPPQLGAQLCQTGSLGPLGDSLPLVFSFSWGSSPVGTLLHVEDLLLDARPLSPPGCLAVCSTNTYGCPGSATSVTSRHALALDTSSTAVPWHSLHFCLLKTLCTFLWAWLSVWKEYVNILKILWGKISGFIVYCSIRNTSMVVVNHFRVINYHFPMKILL